MQAIRPFNFSGVVQTPATTVQTPQPHLVLFGDEEDMFGPSPQEQADAALKKALPGLTGSQYSLADNVLAFLHRTVTDFGGLLTSKGNVLKELEEKRMTEIRTEATEAVLTAIRNGASPTAATVTYEKHGYTQYATDPVFQWAVSEGRTELVEAFFETSPEAVVTLVQENPAIMSDLLAVPERNINYTGKPANDRITQLFIEHIGVEAIAQQLPVSSVVIFQNEALLDAFTNAGIYLGGDEIAPIASKLKAEFESGTSRFTAENHKSSPAGLKGQWLFEGFDTIERVLSLAEQAIAPNDNSTLAALNEQRDALRADIQRFKEQHNLVGLQVVSE